MTTIPYHGFRFPKAIIQHAIWLYLRFTLSLRDVEELLAERASSWRWQKLLDKGVYRSLTEIAEAETISKSNVSRILRLALLALPTSSRPYSVVGRISG